MTPRSPRRWRNSILTMLAAVGIVWGHGALRGRLDRIDYLTGWTLAGVILFLALYNGRKKVPFLPLGRSEAWMQAHLCLGLLAFPLFLAHANYRVPSGWFEISLAAVFGVVMLSGVAGWILSRQIPRRLSVKGGEVFFERIPALRRALLGRAEQLALDSARDTGAATLLEFYTRELRDYFTSGTRYFRHFFEDQSVVQRVLARVGDLKRFTNEQENQVLDQFADMVREKDRLDYHAALQGILKGWLFVHIPFTLSLLLLTLVHLVLVFAFSSGAP